MLRVSLAESFLLLSSVPPCGRAGLGLATHLLMDVVVVSSLGLLQMEPLCTFVSESLCGPVSSVVRNRGGTTAAL